MTDNTDPSRTHIIPQGDQREHIEDIWCPCMPVVEDTVVTHNSYDGRELGEVCRHAVCTLLEALEEHKYVWTKDSKQVVIHAVELLNMHYPAHEEEPDMPDIGN